MELLILPDLFGYGRVKQGGAEKNGNVRLKGLGLCELSGVGHRNRSTLEDRLNGC